MRGNRARQGGRGLRPPCKPGLIERSRCSTVEFSLAAAVIRRGLELVPPRTVRGLFFQFVGPGESRYLFQGQYNPNVGFAGCSCRVCGTLIARRRRNGFCSDCCRLRAGRVARHEWLNAALASIEGS